MANGPSAPAITPHDANDDQMSLIDIRSRVFEPLKFFKQRVNIVDTPGHGSCSVTEACDSGNSNPPVMGYRSIRRAPSSYDCDEPSSASPSGFSEGDLAMNTLTPCCTLTITCRAPIENHDVMPICGGPMVRLQMDRGNGEILPEKQFAIRHSVSSRIATTQNAEKGLLASAFR
jgi:hypothetical protein